MIVVTSNLIINTHELVTSVALQSPCNGVGQMWNVAQVTRINFSTNPSEWQLHVVSCLLTQTGFESRDNDDPVETNDNDRNFAALSRGIDKSSKQQ